MLPGIEESRGDAMHLVELREGGAQALVAPGIGGALAAFRWQHGGEVIDWLRPTSAEPIATRDAGAMACFPLVPFSNRVRAGRFTFQGRDVALPVTPGDPNFEHGHGWRQPWTVAAQGPAHATLRYRHAPDRWPWAYEATQRFALANGALAVTVELRNLAAGPMPAGFGLHPYFPATPAARVETRVGGMWETDAEVLPTRHAPVAPEALPIRVAETALDNVFTGWSRRATIVWPERGAALDLDADAPLDFLVMYTPPGEAFFCAEPVSNATDAFNSPLPARRDGEAGSGLIVLAPGETAAATVRFRPRLTVSEPPQAN